MVRLGGSLVEPTPDLLPVIEGKTPKGITFLLLIVVHYVDASLPDRSCGIALPEIDFPEFWWTACWPRGCQGHLAVHDVAVVRSPEMRPVRFGPARFSVEGLQGAFDIDRFHHLGSRTRGGWQSSCGSLSVVVHEAHSRPHGRRRSEEKKEKAARHQGHHSHDDEYELLLSKTTHEAEDPVAG